MTRGEDLGIPEVPGSPELLDQQSGAMALTGKALGLTREVLDAPPPADPELVRAARRAVREALAASNAMEGFGVEASGVESLGNAIDELVGSARQYLEFADQAMTRRGY